ncbi:hypothetical protein IHE45_10G046800 [Dioscorea alata]|uniref:Uncharacterized protein n=1 Tax=Dioscorea alata TaxID=55571 RepID=A0ACB7VAT2_DIOAL|nr:hypothetical protein IHE45_10G046800 [Dioscorea alata]
MENNNNNNNNNNMSSYSKMTMKPNNTTNFTSPKPKSMDLSELIHENNFNQHGQLKIMEEEDGEQFGDILRRNRSSVSQRFRSSEKGTSLQDVVKRAFSMRRPSSVAECYWRFHDIGDGLMVHEDDEEQQQQQETKSCSKRKGGRRFFKACKSFLKF